MKRPIYSLLLFVILFLFSCNPQESKKIPPKAVKGVLDLRHFDTPDHSNEQRNENDSTGYSVTEPSRVGWDFEKDGTINLDGEWEFYWKEFVPPEVTPILNSELRILNENPPIQNPKLKIKNYIPVPTQWQNHGYPVDGYATYRLRILLPESKPDDTTQISTAQKDPFKIHNSKLIIPLSIAMTDAGASYEMYVNGKLASVNGKVGKTKEESVPFRQHRNFPIDRFLYNFESSDDAKTLWRHHPIPDKNEIEIIVHVSNFHHIMSGLWLPFKLGSTIEIEKRAKQKLILDLFVIASLLMMGLYHLGLYLNRKKDKTALYFGVFCILFAIRTSSLDESVILDIVPNLSFLIIHKFEYFAFFYGSYAFAQYIHSLFPTEFEKKWIRVLSFILFPLSAVVILSPLKIYAYTLLPAQITVLLSILYIFKVQIFAAFHRLSGAKLILVSWAIFALTVVNDILNGMSLIVTPLLVQYGFVAFIFMQSIILSRRFAGGFEEAEKLSDDLQVLTQSLESKISDGVREKEKYSQCLLELSKSKTKELFGFESALREITEICSKILNVDRVSLWKLDLVKDELKCIELFIAKENKHENGMRFICSKFPKYFQYLKEEDILSAANVYEHKGIMEFNEDYHTVLNIQSALDSPVRSGGNLIGVISCEKLEIKKEWTVDEENFVSSLTNILASLFESDERKKAYGDLIETKKEIEDLVTFSHLINSLSDLNSIFIEISKYFYHTFGINGVWLFLPDEKKEFLGAYKVYSYNKLSADKYDYMMNKKIPLNENEGGIVYKTFQRKKPFYLGKIPKFEFEIDREIVKKLSLISFLQVPLVRKEECAGVLTFSNFDKEMKLSKKEISMIANLCSQIAGTVDTIHLLQQVEVAKTQADSARIEAEIERGISVIAKLEVEKAKKKTEGLNHLIKNVNETSDLEEIMKIILSYVKDNYNLPYYSLFTLDPKENVLKFANSIVPDYVTSEHKKVISSSVFSVTEKNMESIHSRALALKTPIFIPDAETEVKTKMGKVIQGVLKNKSFITLPIILQNNPIGTLDFFSLEPISLREEEITELSLLAEQLAGVIQGATLFTQVQEEKEKALIAREESEKQKKEIETLNEFTKLINSTSDISTIFKEIYSYLNRTFGFTNLWVLLVDKSKKELYADINTTVYKEGISFDIDFFNNFSVKLDEKLGTLYQTYNTATPLYVADVSVGDIKTKTFINGFNGKTYASSKTDFKIILKGKLKSILQIPLILQNEVIGIVCLSIFDKLLELSHEEIEKLVRFSNQIAGVINNAQLLKQTEEAKEVALVSQAQADIERELALSAQKDAEKAKSQIEFLNEFSKVINSYNNLDIIFSHAVENLSNKIDTDIFQLQLVDKTKNELFTRCLSGTDSGLMNKYNKLRVPLIPESGSLYLAYVNKKTLYLKNIKRIAENKKSELDKMVEKDFQTDSVFLIPLLVNDEVIGIMSIGKLGGMKKLSKDEVRFVESLCEQLALAVNNSFLLEETENARKETEGLNDLMRNINSVSSLIDIMSFIMYYLETEYNFNDFYLLLNEESEKKLIPFSFTSTRHTEEERHYFLNSKIKHSDLQGVFANIFETKRAVFVEKENIQEDDRIVKEWIEKGRFDYLFLLPLVIYDELIGILLVSSPKEISFPTQEIRRKVERFADMIAGSVFNAKLLKKVEVAKEEADNERSKSEKLLLNILPKDVAAELKDKGFAEPVLFENVSVMFTDFKGFTTIAETLTPQELIKDLDACFVQFDKISERFNLEKLKTIGDSYMCAGGIPRRNTTHAIDCCLAALEIQSFMNLMKKLKEEKGFPYWELRLGIHTGPLIAGVIGERKFAYDVWGDTVNTASRMESSGTPGKINISFTTYELVKEFFDCEYRGEVNAKNKGVVKMYYLNRIKPEFSKDEEGLMPNGKFWKIYG